ncbi:hypothetical protein SRH_02920 [Mesomycoplasma hyorhinis MCLD]|uniref:Uncharacterized protein n=1 Tax=Mesomycoplasma hyorhinis (strain MCLD) TaxID=936139 RepID=A0ABM5M6S5_MESHM|nr:hypothetical protein SRH_02920 [Mesomycoplasma hyorhinis MCLD]
MFWSKISLISFKKEEKIYFLEPKIQKQTKELHSIFWTL